MGKNTNIEWTQRTLNLWWGCHHHGKGCENCYAEQIAQRFYPGKDLWGKDRMYIASAFQNLDKWQKEAQKKDTFFTVFVGSMMDIFEKPMPLHNPTHTLKTTEDVRNLFFENISKNKYPNLVFLMLTKRPNLLQASVPEQWVIKQPINVWFGASASTQRELEYAITSLMGSCLRNLFLSLEPQVEELFLENIADAKCIDWIIQGGESGNNARPIHPDWVRRVRDFCKDNHIPYFFKQWGEYIACSPEHLQGYIDEHNKEITGFNVHESGFFETNLDTWVYERNSNTPKILKKVGKKAAGNTIDGVQYMELPNFRIGISFFDFDNHKYYYFIEYVEEYGNQEEKMFDTIWDCIEFFDWRRDLAKYGHKDHIKSVKFYMRFGDNTKQGIRISYRMFPHFLSDGIEIAVPDFKPSNC